MAEPNKGTLVFAGIIGAVLVVGGSAFATHALTRIEGISVRMESAEGKQTKLDSSVSELEKKVDAKIGELDKAFDLLVENGRVQLNQHADDRKETITNTIDEEAQRVVKDIETQAAARTASAEGLPSNLVVPGIEQGNVVGTLMVSAYNMTDGEQNTWSTTTFLIRSYNDGIDANEKNGKATVVKRLESITGPASPTFSIAGIKLIGGGNVKVELDTSDTDDNFHVACSFHGTSFQ